MSGLLGVDFFRIVNEGLVDDWAQVYARMPFEKEELLNKGALFGVLRIKGKKDLVDKSAEIFVWLDEFFNKTDKGGKLRELMEGLIGRNSELQSAWVWIMIDGETGERVVKSVALNGGRVVIIRKRQRVILSDGERWDQVVVGNLKRGDRLGMGVGGMINELDELGEEKNLEEIAGDLKHKLEGRIDRAIAGLLLEIKKKEEGSFDEEQELEGEMSVSKNRFGVGRETIDNEITSADKIVVPDGMKRIVGGWLANFKKRKGVKVWGKKRSGRMLWLAGVFLTLFTISVVMGVIKNRNQSAKSKWQNELSSWQRREEEAKLLVKMNPAGARKLLIGVKQEVEKAGEVWRETKFEKEWMDYRFNLDESWSDVSGEKKVEPKLFLVLDLIRPKLVGDRIVGLGESVGVIDLKEGLMLKIALVDKKADVMDSDEKKDWRAMGGNEKEAVFLTSKGLSLSGGENSLDFDATVSNPVGVEVFGNGIYVLDAGVGEVWKFDLTGNKIQERRRWLELDEKIGVNEVVDMDIDGDIWVLGKKGEVSKLRRGNRERFSLEGKPEGLTGERVAVQTDGERLAILDNDSSRVVVFSKETGEYESQLVWEGFKTAKDIVYVKDERLMVLSEGKLYWVE